MAHRRSLKIFNFYCSGIWPIPSSLHFHTIVSSIGKILEITGYKVFIDDGLGTHRDRGTLLEHSDLVKNTLLKAGFVVNENKSVWTPTQFTTWLGVEINLGNGIFKTRN